MEISLFPKLFSRGIRIFISGVSPLFEMQITASSFCMVPRSPCIASDACIKIEGVPVELNVATIFCPIIALLPIPVTITLPFIFEIKCTVSTKSSLINFFNWLTASASISSVLIASFLI